MSSFTALSRAVSSLLLAAALFSSRSADACSQAIRTRELYRVVSDRDAAVNADAGASSSASADELLFNLKTEYGPPLVSGGSGGCHDPEDDGGCSLGAPSGSTPIHIFIAPTVLDIALILRRASRDRAALARTARHRALFSTHLAKVSRANSMRDTKFVR